MQQNLIKIKRIRVENNELILERTFRSWKLRPDDVVKINLQPVSSLVDEIGVFLESKKVFFLTDAICGFQEAVELLDFSNLFGPDWYKRADGGELLMWTKKVKKRK